MEIRDDLYYTDTHEWIHLDGDIATIGISDFAQHELGDIVFVELPEVGQKVAASEPCGSIEAVKAVEDLISPLSGKVEEKNIDLEDSPELINKSPYEEGWLFKIRMSNPEELENLLSAAEYQKIIP
ncbi:MAG: glycine cleavage system protein GcvH [Candidatus Cloacimonadota bacterium]|jgi:glycine cleavage system H protein|nr:glycine cleavage system protein GcvH [Candidatus Cloacimonas sp.]MDD3606154.1 glycine cleavage system protein GcvH [Candidatus Cloacimonas acidaminovorans]MDI9571645.1 glycine cleavage system protein GcvH [Candidatus Cloacimonadota bacterium]OQC72547.1 MAG: Glycine cleavage system H protein [Candidatus Cloacimonetes bacterium ADurb.Bin003]MDD5407215.1 glycine cleavage system protein GcvH [Candidatus Cloacimonas acidaminovorans]